MLNSLWNVLVKLDILASEEVRNKRNEFHRDLRMTMDVLSSVVIYLLLRQ